MPTTDPSIKRLKAGRVECIVTFDDTRVQHAEREAIESLGSSITIDGFRPGKAPTAMLREHIKPEALLKETIRNLLPETFASLVRDSDLKPIIPPKVDVAHTSPLTLKITIVERPEVRLKPVANIRIGKRKPTVDDEDVERMMRYILHQHQTSVDVERPAQDHDRLTIDFHGEDESGKDIEGTRSTDYQVVIGSNMLIPGFEDALKGLKNGDTKDFTLMFPQTYHEDSLRGKPATFHVTVKRVEEMTIPKLTNAFAKEKLGVASVMQFKDNIRTSMQKQEERMEEERRESEAFEAIRRAVDVELAPELIAHEAQTLMQELQEELHRRSITLEEWIEQSGKKADELEKELGEQAEHRLQLQFGMEKYIEEKEIRVSDEEMDRAIEEFLKPLSQSERGQIAPAYSKNQKEYAQFKWRKTVEKAIESLVSG